MQVHNLSRCFGSLLLVAELAYGRNTTAPFIDSVLLPAEWYCVVLRLMLSQLADIISV